MSTYRYTAGLRLDAAMASINMVWEYWESGQYNYDQYDVYPCGCCACCGCSCGGPEDLYDVPVEFHWYWVVRQWAHMLEDEAYAVEPSLDGSTRGTTAFAVRRRKVRRCK